MKRLGAGALIVLLVLQIMAVLRVAIRLGTTARGSRIPTVGSAHAPRARVTVIVPVLNEEHRLGPCLAGLMAQPDTVAEILVVDGGSTDRTQELVQRASAQDSRIRWIDASPPANWNGKAWNIQIGLDNARRDS